MYQIFWKSIVTGETGHGTELFQKEQAEQIVKDLNRQNAGVLVHWCQAVEDTSPTPTN